MVTGGGGGVCACVCACVRVCVCVERTYVSSCRTNFENCSNTNTFLVENSFLVETLYW